MLLGWLFFSSLSKCHCSYDVIGLQASAEQLSSLARALPPIGAFTSADLLAEVASCTLRKAGTMPQSLFLDIASSLIQVGFTRVWFS